MINIYVIGALFMCGVMFEFLSDENISIWKIILIFIVVIVFWLFFLGIGANDLYKKIMNHEESTKPAPEGK